MRIRIPALAITAAVLLLSGCDSDPTGVQSPVEQRATPPSRTDEAPPADSTGPGTTRNGAGMFGSGT